MKSLRERNKKNKESHCWVENLLRRPKGVKKKRNKKISRRKPLLRRLGQAIRMKTSWNETSCFQKEREREKENYENIVCRSLGGRLEQQWRIKRDLFSSYLYLSIIIFHCSTIHFIFLHSFASICKGSVFSTGFPLNL